MTFPLRALAVVVVLGAHSGRAALPEKGYLPPSGAALAGGGPGLLPPFADGQRPVVPRPPGDTSRPDDAPRAGVSGAVPLGGVFGTMFIGGVPGSVPGGSVPGFDAVPGGFPGAVRGAAPARMPIGAPRGEAGSAASLPAPPEVAIIKMINENPGDGTFTYSYETANGIELEEHGEVRDDGNLAVRGMYAFTAPDGVRYSVSYTADENGFQAVGDHLPTPPPIPEAIQKLLDDMQVLQQVGDGGYDVAGRPSVLPDAAPLSPSRSANADVGSVAAEASSTASPSTPYRPPSSAPEAAPLSPSRSANADVGSVAAEASSTASPSTPYRPPSSAPEAAPEVVASAAAVPDVDSKTVPSVPKPQAAQAGSTSISTSQPPVQAFSPSSGYYY